MPCRFPRKIYAGRRHSASAGNQKPVQVKPFKSNRSGQRKRARSEENLDFGEQRRVAFDAEPVSERQHLGVAFVVHQRQFHLARAGMAGQNLPEPPHMRLVERDRRQHNRQRTFILRLQRRHGEFGGAHAHCLIALLHLAADLYHGVDGELGRGGLVHLAEEHALDGAFHVFDGHDGPGVALLGYAPVHIW